MPFFLMSRLIRWASSCAPVVYHVEILLCQKRTYWRPKADLPSSLISKLYVSDQLPTWEKSLPSVEILLLPGKSCHDGLFYTCNGVSIPHSVAVFAHAGWRPHEHCIMLFHEPLCLFPLTLAPFWWWSVEFAVDRPNFLFSLSLTDPEWHNLPNNVIDEDGFGQHLRVKVTVAKAWSLHFWSKGVLSFRKTIHYGEAIRALHTGEQNQEKWRWWDH